LEKKLEREGMEELKCLVPASIILLTTKAKQSHLESNIIFTDLTTSPAQELMIQRLILITSTLLHLQWEEDLEALMGLKCLVLEITILT